MNVPAHLVLDSYDRFYDDEVHRVGSTTCAPPNRPLRRGRRQKFSKFSSLKKQSPMVWEIVGTYNSELAYSKFSTFAMVSVLLVPDALKLFRDARKKESYRKRSKRLASHDGRVKQQENKRINKLVEALLLSLRKQKHEGGAVFPPPHWIGEPRPAQYVSVPVESLYREIPSKTKKLLRSLGKSGLLFQGSRMNRMMSAFTRSANMKNWLLQQLSGKKKELMENTTVEYLRRSQMGDQRIAAVYDVLVGGVALAAVAKQRGLDKSNLRQVVNRVKRDVRPTVEAQIKAWASGDKEILQVVVQVGTLDTQKAVMVNLSPAQVRRERIAETR
jgi:transposase-like protein